jgi:polyglycine hydrolase-like protein
MVLDQLRVSFHLKNLVCHDEGDGSGNAEPFLWVVYFKVDGDTVFVGDDLKLHGSATVVGTPGSHGNLPDDVDAGDTVTIPSVLGKFTTTLRPIPTPFAGKTVGGMCGFIAILLEEDSTSDHDINVGHAALNHAVQTGIDKLIKTLGVTKQEVTDAEIAALEKSISTKVESAIANEVDFFQGIWSYIGFGNGQDDKLGTAKFLGTHGDLAKKVGDTQNLSWKWNPGDGEGSWTMNASVTVHKTAAAAIMRSGDWGSRFLFGRTTQQFVSQNQSLFDDKGLRLLQMETFVDNGVRKWSSVHRSGTWAHRLTIDRSRETFLSETQTLFDDKGLRLENMVTYVDDGVRRWAGSYRSGDWAHRLIIDRDGTTFAHETQDLFDKKGLRMEQMVTYVDNGVRRWAGIYRSGNWAHRFTMDRDTATFLHETQTWFDQDGLRLIDVERYEVNGQARWAGIYRSGEWGHRLIIDRGVESLLAEVQAAFDDKGLRLVGVDVYDL